MWVVSHFGSWESSPMVTWWPLRVTASTGSVLIGTLGAPLCWLLTGWDAPCRAEVGSQGWLAWCTGFRIQPRNARYSRHDKLTRNTVYTVQTNVISPSETASAVTQLSRSGTRCPLRGSRCGCSSISHAVAMQFRQQATEEPLPQQHHSRCPSETAPAVTQSPGSPPHGTHAPHYSIPASVTHSGQR